MTESENDRALIVFDGDHLRAVLFRPELPDLLVTFDHRQPGKADFGQAKPLRQAVDRGWATLRIMTRRNDWFINSETLDLERALIGGLADFRRRHAIGYSMGGYAVFRFARAIGLQSAIAASPQYSVSRDVLPWDKRFHDEARDFDAGLGDLAARRHEALRALIVLDPFHRPDLGNAELIVQAFPSTRLLRLGFAGHPATRALTRHGKGGVLIGQVLAESHDPAALRLAYRQTRRQMPDFWRRMAAAAKRHPALADHARKAHLGLLSEDAKAGPGAGFIEAPTIR